VNADREGLTGLPVNLLVRDRHCVVVGAGRIAARKVDSLLAVGARVTVVAPDVGEELRERAARGEVTLVTRPFEPSDVDDAWLVITATDDPAVNTSVFEACESARVWANSADDPANCSYTLMSTVRRSDIVVAIGTGGRSPALAKHLRQTLAATVGPEYETLLELLSTEREAMRAAGRSSEDADWQKLFDSGIVEMVREGRLEDARELLRTCL